MIPWRNLKRFLSKIVRQPGYALSVGIRRMQAYVFYTYGHGRSSLPEAVTLFLTHRCNLRCKMCGQWGEGGVTKEMDSQAIREELPLEHFKKLIADLGRQGTNVTLFGGEPLLNSHCLELIHLIKAQGLHCLMITNGSLLERFARELVEAKLDELNISLDGGQTLHDEIRGLPGIFSRIATGVQAVNRIKKELGVKKPLINLQCTISKYNYQQLEQLLTVARDLEADSLTYHNLIFLDRSVIARQQEADKALSSSSPGWEGFVFEPGFDPEKLFCKIEEIRAGRYPFAVDFYPNFSREGLKDYYQNPNYRPREYPGRCLSPWIAAYVFPDGEVRPCLNSSYSYGNIKAAPFAQIWNSSKAIGFRRTLKTSKLFPACIRCTELYRY